MNSLFSLLQTDEEILVDLRKKNQKLSEKLSKMPKKVVDDKVWQYWLWSFQGRDTKLERFLAKNQL